MTDSLKINDYLRKSEFPTIWCPGCGHGIVTKAAIRAIAKLGWDKDDVLAVSGIGCSARTPAYLDFNSIQTTHGRAIAFATGMKMHRPDKKVVLFLGDGDCSAIGGNHLIHAARRNIDLTVIVMNNYIYGMTGGQCSPTTPTKSRSTTTVYGNVDRQLDLCEVAKAAGATFVARTTAYHVNELASLIEKGLKNKGFSFIECLTPCPTGYGNRNKMGNPVALYDWLRNAAINSEKAKNLSAEELKEKVMVGVLKETQEAEYIDSYEQMMAEAQKNAEEEREFLDLMKVPEAAQKLDRFEMRLSGSGGQGLILAGIMLSEAAIRQGKKAVHSQSYGPEARGGASRSEVILSDDEINFPEVICPDVLLAMTQQSYDKFAGNLQPGGVILVDSTFVKANKSVDAKVYSFPITEIANTLGNVKVANVVALGMLARISGLFSLEVLEKSVLARVPEKVKEINQKALRQGYAYAGSARE